MQIRRQDTPEETPRSLGDLSIQRPCKTGKPQYTCKHNFLNAIQACMPELTENEQGLFKKWIPLTLNEEAWNS